MLLLRVGYELVLLGKAHAACAGCVCHDLRECCYVARAVGVLPELLLLRVEHDGFMPKRACHGCVLGLAQCVLQFPDVYAWHAFRALFVCFGQ